MEYRADFFGLSKENIVTFAGVTDKVGRINIAEDHTTKGMT